MLHRQSEAACGLGRDWAEDHGFLGASRAEIYAGSRFVDRTIPARLYNARVDWQELVRKELDTAKAARGRGNEGMARVCARRAAGWAVKAYLAEKGTDLNSPSVLLQMRHLQKDADLGPNIQKILKHLLIPKQKDTLESDSYFPPNIDLLAEAQQLIRALFPSFKLD